MNIGKYKNIIFDSETPEGRRGICDIKKKNPNATIVFATGCFDVAQPGHAIFTEQLRLVGEETSPKVIVVIGVGRDSTLKTLKQKGRPINPEMNRAYLLASYKNVDYVVLNGGVVGEHKIDFANVTRLLEPDIFVLNSNDSEIEAKKILCQELGISFKLVDRVTPKFLTPTSTTEIINKINNLKN